MGEALSIPQPVERRLGMAEHRQSVVFMAPHGENLREQCAGMADKVGAAELLADGEGLGEVIVDLLDCAGLVIAPLEANPGRRVLGAIPISGSSARTC